MKAYLGYLLLFHPRLSQLIGECREEARDIVWRHPVPVPVPVPVLVQVEGIAVIRKGLYEKVSG